MRLSVLPLLLAFAAPAVSAESEPPLEALPTVEVPSDKAAVTLAGVERYLGNIKTLSAGFVQTAPDGASARGRLYLERPGRVRFEYTDGTPVLIVADGPILNFIDYEVGQITRWPVADTPLAPLMESPFAFGTRAEVAAIGAGALAGLTAVTAFDPAKPEQGTFTMIFGGSDASGLALLAWEVVDAQGALTRIALEDTRLNGALDKNLWTFEDPRGERFQRRRTR